MQDVSPSPELSATGVAPISAPPVAAAKRKATLLPVLVVLFLFSYGLMAMLIVEQGRTIESQRGLIQNIFRDTVELTSLKGKIFQQNRAESLAHAAPPKVPTPAPTVPGPDKAEAPSPLANQSDPQNKVASGKKLRKEKPPNAADDEPNRRRMNLVI